MNQLLKFIFGNIQVYKLFGIPVKVDNTLSILLIAILIGIGPQALLLTFTMYTCVLIHEYGHCFAAYRCGIPTRDITMSIVGGRALLREIPTDPKKELYITLCGPVMNLIITEAIFLTGTTSMFWTDIAFMNVILFIFNMIPAIPMDGGRILRAVLAMKFSHMKATRWAAHLSKCLGVIMIIIGITNYMFILAIIGVIVITGSSQEYQNSVQIHYSKVQDHTYG